MHGLRLARSADECRVLRQPYAPHHALATHPPDCSTFRISPVLSLAGLSPGAASQDLPVVFGEDKGKGVVLRAQLAHGPEGYVYEV